MKKLSLLLLVFCTFSYGHSQTIELDVFGGYTVMEDVESWAETTLSSWDMFNYGGKARVLFGNSEKIQFGVEAGYQYLGSYTVRQYYYYSSYPSYYDVGMNLINASALVRFNHTSRFFTDLGAGYSIVNENYSYVCMNYAIGYKIPIAGNISIPIKIQGIVIPNSYSIIAPVNIGAGISADL